MVARVHHNKNDIVLVGGEESNALERGPSGSDAESVRLGRGNGEARVELGLERKRGAIVTPELVVGTSACRNLHVASIVLTAIHDLEALAIEVGRDHAVRSTRHGLKVPGLVDASCAGPHKDVGAIGLTFVCRDHQRLVVCQQKQKRWNDESDERETQTVLLSWTSRQ